MRKIIALTLLLSLTSLTTGLETLPAQSEPSVSSAESLNKIRLRVQRKAMAVQARGPQWVAEGGDPAAIMSLMQEFDAHLQAGKIVEAEASIDQASALVGISASAGGSNSVTPAMNLPLTAQNTPEKLNPVTGPEIRYLCFQIFTGSENPEVPFDTAVTHAKKEDVARMAQNIIDTIGERGTANTRLGFVIGPLSFDQTDEETRQMIRDAFDIALEKNIAVGFHIDDSMFWSKRADLTANPDNVEWADWNRTPSRGLKIDWAKPPAKMRVNAPQITQEVKRRAREVIGREIRKGIDRLEAQGRGDLFAGVIVGWETHMGQDVKTQDRLGYGALARRGFSAGNPPKDVSAEIASIVQEFIGLWTRNLAAAGIDKDKIYSHINFLPKAQFEAMKAASPNFPKVDYDYVVDAAPSSQRPAVAFGEDHRAGFSTYPSSGVFDQIYQELAKRGNPPWASSEGTNLIPGQEVGSTGIDMESYLAKMYNHGATLVNVFSWGIGGEKLRKTWPFRIATEGEEAIAAYRKFLTNASPAAAGGQTIPPNRVIFS